MDANCFTKFLSEKWCPVLEPSGDIYNRKRQQSNRHRAAVLAWACWLRPQGPHLSACLLLEMLPGPWNPRDAPRLPLGRCCQALMGPKFYTKTLPHPPHQLSFTLSLPTLATGSWEILLEKFFFPFKTLTPHLMKVAERCSNNLTDVDQVRQIFCCESYYSSI